MKNRSLLHRVLMPGICTLLTACGDGTGTEQTAPQGQAAPAAAPSTVQTRRPWVDLQELDCLIADLPVHFKGSDGAGEPVALTGTTVDVNVAALRTEVAKVSPGANEAIGVTIHYGMKAEPDSGGHELVYALELSIVADKGTYVEVVPQAALFFELEDGELKEADRAAWYQGKLGHYRGHIRVREQEGGAWEAYDPYTALTSYTFPWEERMEAVLDQNPTAVKLRVFSLAEPATREPQGGGGYLELQWRHIIAVAGVNDAGALLVDNEDHGTQQFQMRALDLGSPCPPLCDGVAFFRTEGVPVREECQ